MLFHLPSFNATLNPCLVNPTTAFTAHANGHFCGSCQRVVQDFSQSTNPVADLAAARAAAPDGRVCGRFSHAQIVAPPPLTRRLKWFLVALVMVVSQGLTAREALAQVRRAVPHRVPVAPKKHLAAPETQVQTVTVTSGIVGEELPLSPSDTTTVRTYAEVMPTLQGRNYMETVAYIQQQVHWPKGAGTTDAGGRVFVGFTVGKNGLLRDVRVLKGIHPLFDAEALRVVRELPALTPGRQNGKLVAVGMVVPVMFKLE